jgi:hypothetical protein
MFVEARRVSKGAQHTTQHPFRCSLLTRRASMRALSGGPPWRLSCSNYFFSYRKRDLSFSSRNIRFHVSDALPKRFRFAFRNHEFTKNTRRRRASAR